MEQGNGEPAEAVTLPAGSLEADRLQALLDFVAVVARSARTADLLEVLAAESRTALGSATASLSVWERDRGLMRTLINHGRLGPREVARPTDEIYQLAGHPMADRMFREGIGYRADVRDPATDPHMRAILEGEVKASGLAVPIMFEGRIWGELWATREADEPAFDQADLEFARLVAALVGAGIAQAEHLERVERLAYTDDLTGLANRRAFEDRLDEVLDAHHVHGTAVGLVVVDVNGLKRINDQIGHHAGDASLVAFADELAACASTVPGTLAVRLSGDEFCLLTVGASGDVVVDLATDLCRRADAVLDDGVACGVATTDDLPTTSVTPARMLRAADAAQYRAKRSHIRVPVVSGRTQADGDSDAGPPPGERRRFRGRGHAASGRVLDDVVQALDDSDDRDPRRRLAAVAEIVARTVDAAGWFVSYVAPGAEAVTTVDSAVSRRTDTELGASYFADDAYPLEEFPATFAALSGRAVSVDVDDPRSDAAEVALLTLGGLSQLLMSGGADLDAGRWLVEIVGDELSAPMRAYAATLRAGIALALRP